MDTHDYEEALIKELKKLLAEYDKRIRLNQGTHHQHLSPATLSGMIGVGMSAGSVLGTAIPIPVAGTAAGGSAGLGLALGIAGIIESYYHRHNKKIDNAAIVNNFFGEDKKERNGLIRKAAHKVIKDRKEILNELPNPEKAKKPIAAYLAANMMAAIKHNPDSDHKLRTIREGVGDTRSKKVSDHAIDGNDLIRLKDIARFRK